MRRLGFLNAAIGACATMVAMGFANVAASQERFVHPACEGLQAPERAYRKVIDGLEQTETLVIEGPEWDDVLVSNCLIQDVDGDGIIIRNVSNLTIRGCTIQDASGNGIRLRSSGSTDGVHIIDNSILSVGKNGISAAKRSETSVDHTAAVIMGNRIIDSALAETRGRQHGIYSQVSDVRIIGNLVSGIRGGNGISVRSSGLVACNLVEGVSKNGKPGIRYYPDHTTGPSRTLEVRNNRILDAEVGIDLHAETMGKSINDSDLVRNFRIIDNILETEVPVRIHKRWQNSTFEVIVSGNKTITAN